MPAIKPTKSKSREEEHDLIIRKLNCIQKTVDEIQATGHGSLDPSSSASGIDAFWAYEGQAANPFVLPNEPYYIYTFHRNGIEQNESEYNITGAQLEVYPPLGSTNAGRDEILELRYKYIN